MQTLQPHNSLQGGKYRILSVLGQGGFGVTYLAMQSGLEIKVAIKEYFLKGYCSRQADGSVVPVQSAEARDLVDRHRAKFLKEARNIAKLNHPNIVGVSDVFEENGTAYYVMTYAEGGSLSSLLSQHGPMPESIAIGYITQVAKALQYIHSLRITHLDVKPSNVVLDRNGHALLIDFGLAKQYDTDSGDQTSTSPVAVSEGYAPFEQTKAGGVSDFSPQSDVYSLGATLYKLLTDVRPPHASDIYDTGLPIQLLQAKGVTPNTIHLISRAMMPRKADRLQSVDAFLQLLSMSKPKEVVVPEDKVVVPEDKVVVPEDKVEVPEDEVMVVAVEVVGRPDVAPTPSFPQPQNPVVSDYRKPMTYNEAHGLPTPKGGSDLSSRWKAYTLRKKILILGILLSIILTLALIIAANS